MFDSLAGVWGVVYIEWWVEYILQLGRIFISNLTTDPNFRFAWIPTRLLTLHITQSAVKIKAFITIATMVQEKRNLTTLGAFL